MLDALSEKSLPNPRFPSPSASLLPQAITVTNQTSLAAARDLIGEGYRDVLCLNFASANNPGGGLLGGSQAQEESLARSTGLYNCLLRAPAYYVINQKTSRGIYTDHMIYSPDVPVIKDDSGVNLDRLTTCTFLTAPTLNKGAVRQNAPELLGEVEKVMKRRIRKVLAISLREGHSTLVLGAWGCGVFRNDPAAVAGYFHDILMSEF